MKKKRESIRDTIAEAVENELKKVDTERDEDKVECSLDDELDFYHQDFGTIEDNEFE